MEKRPAQTVADFPPEILSAFDQYVQEGAGFGYEGTLCGTLLDPVWSY